MGPRGSAQRCRGSHGHSNRRGASRKGPDDRRAGRGPGHVTRCPHLDSAGATGLPGVGTEDSVSVVTDCRQGPPPPEVKSQGRAAHLPLSVTGDRTSPRDPCRPAQTHRSA